MSQNDDLMTAAMAVLTHRNGELPVAGWLADNDASRRDLEALQKAVNARLRGEAAQGEQQAVAWVSPKQLDALRRGHDSVSASPHKWRTGRQTVPLYTRPQPAAPAPVAGDAVAYWLAVDSDGTVHYGLTTADANDGEASRQQVNDFINETDPSQRIVGVAALAQDRAAQGALYSLDADPAGIRDRAAAAITGALILGSRGDQEPPAGHWLEPFWKMARAEAELRAAQAGAAGVPDAIELLDVPALPSDWGSRNGYKSGWNDCRAAMLAAAPTPTPTPPPPSGASSMP